MKTIIWLVLFFPYGLYRMWKYENWSPSVKIGITTLIAIAFVAGLRQEKKTTTAESAPQTLTLDKDNLQTVVYRSMGGVLVDDLKIEGNGVVVSYKTDDYFKGDVIQKTYLTTAAKLFANFEELDNVTLTSVQAGNKYHFQISYNEFERYTTFGRKSLRDYWNQYDNDFIHNKDKRLLFFERYLK